VIDSAHANPLEAARPAGPCVWAVGGGKGGVGKSVLTANLAIALARRGRRCVVLDADLGGANLHTILGVRKPHRTLSDFVSRAVPGLADVLCETPIPNLHLLSGARAFLDMANPKHTQKERLLRHVQTLEADHVFLDLSAGSAFNVLDFFLAARRGIVVVVPEPTSVENAYHFLKAAFFRSLSRATRHPGVRMAVEQVAKERGELDVHSPRELLARVLELDPVAGAALAERARAFAPLLVVNQARTPEHRTVGNDMVVACREYLGTELDYIGAVARDEAVHFAVSRRQPVLESTQSCAFAKDVEALAQRLLRIEEPDAARPEELNRVYRHRRALFSESSLATHGLLSDEERRAKLAHLEVRYAERVLAPEERPLGAPAVRRPSLPPPDFDEPGAYLRRCREFLGLELKDLHQRTRLGSLEHIEQERFDALPPEPYLRAHVLAYASALGVREAELLAAKFVERYRRARAA
jgi:flagellar biosynthesis protein FlhG